MVLEHPQLYAILSPEDKWGSSAMQMHQATGPFFEWLIDLQERLDVTRKEINSIRESYLTARAEMVSPQEIDKNRSRRRWLRATNAFGQNTAKIAALEAQYAQWVSPPPLTTAPGLAKPATRV